MQTVSATDIVLFDRFRLDRRGLSRRDENSELAPIEIGSRALDVLRVLLERPGDLITRTEIMAAAWPGTVVEDNNPQRPDLDLAPRARSGSLAR